MVLLNLAYEYFNTGNKNKNINEDEDKITDKKINDKIKEKFDEIKTTNEEKEKLIEDTVQSKIQVRELENKLKTLKKEVNHNKMINKELRNKLMKSDIQRRTAEREKTKSQNVSYEVNKRFNKLKNYINKKKQDGGDKLGSKVNDSSKCGINILFNKYKIPVFIFLILLMISFK